MHIKYTHIHTNRLLISPRPRQSLLWTSCGPISSWRNFPTSAAQTASTASERCLICDHHAYSNGRFCVRIQSSAGVSVMILACQLTMVQNTSVCKTRVCMQSTSLYAKHEYVCKIRVQNTSVYTKHECVCNTRVRMQNTSAYAEY